MTCVCAHTHTRARTQAHTRTRVCTEEKWRRWTGVWVWGVPGSFIWISRGRMAHGDKWVSCARTERRHSGSPPPLSLTTLRGLCLCVCNRGPGVCTWASGGRRVRVPVCLCVPPSACLTLSTPAGHGGRNTAACGKFQGPRCFRGPVSRD